MSEVVDDRPPAVASRQPGQEHPDAVRVGVAWRELRRGASMQALRERLYAGLAMPIDLGQVDALDLLIDAGELRMRDLAESLRVDRSTATRAADRLVESGLAERSADPDDGRGVVLHPLAAGIELHGAISERRRRFLHDVMASFDEHEQAQLAELLERMVARVDELLGEL